MGEIETPTLIVVGEEDTATAPENPRLMPAVIAGEEFIRVPQGGHISTIDVSEAINAVLSGFLSKVDGLQ